VHADALATFVRATHPALPRPEDPVDRIAFEGPCIVRGTGGAAVAAHLIAALEGRRREVQRFAGAPLTLHLEAVAMDGAVLEALLALFVEHTYKFVGAPPAPAPCCDSVLRLTRCSVAGEPLRDVCVLSRDLFEAARRLAPGRVPSLRWDAAARWLIALAGRMDAVLGEEALEETARRWCAALASQPRDDASLGWEPVVLTEALAAACALPPADRTARRL
jgi:hypothetical protein